MSDYTLHRFDLDLCGYAAGMVHMYSGPDRRGQLFADDLRERMPCHPAVVDWIGGKPDQPLLLSDEQMHDLVVAVTEVDHRNALGWVPWPHVHSRYTQCLREIEQALAPATKDRFARDSEASVAELERPGISLRRGLEILQAWIATIRDLKRAMGHTVLIPKLDGGQFPCPGRPLLPGESLPKPSHRRRRAAIANAATGSAAADREVLHAVEAARVLGLDHLVRPDNALARLIKRGDLPDRKIGGRRVFPRDAVQSLIERGSRKSRLGRPPGSKTSKARGT